MTLEIWIEGQRKSGNKKAVKDGIALQKRYGEIPLPKTEIASPLEIEWQRQVQRYIDLGFHKELDLSEVEYRASLPKFNSQPEAYKSRFDIPVLVETRISVSRQAALAKLPYFLDGLNVRNWEEDPKGYKTPTTPYTTWMQDGRNYLGDKSVSVANFRQRMDKDERGATVFDGIALYIKDLGVLNHHYIDLPGTSVGSDDAPSLYLWSGRPRLGCAHVDHAAPDFGSASCGR